jgi:predicted DNA-binding transcriptional regulator YafY
MPTDKHQFIRYQALDKCFSNAGRRYFIDDLLQACNKALYDYTGEKKYSGPRPAVCRRNLYNDINFMMSEAGWGAPIKRGFENRRAYYYYEDREFSINNQPLSQNEMEHLKGATLMLSRFKGLPSFGWVEDIITKLEFKFDLNGEKSLDVIGFEQNEYLKGLDLLTLLFNNIVNKQCLKIEYRKFDGTQFVWKVHPYYIKQYNSRWFLFVLDEERRRIMNLPLDRIEKIEHIALDYIPCNIDFTEYFDDVMGVTIPVGQPVEEIHLKFTERRFSYVLTKPMHASQRVNNEECIVKLNLIPNKEFYSRLLSFGGDVEVLQPESVKQEHQRLIAEMSAVYSK